VALLRGINVGRAKRVAMADLRGLLTDLGYGEVRTLLNSGNAIFHAPRPNALKVAAAIEAAVRDRCGFTAPVTVVTEADLGVIIAENSLLQSGRDHSRLLVAFVARRETLALAEPLLAESWTPEALAIGSRAAYLWCANGIIDSKVMQAFARATKDASTARNWATVLKIHEALQA
jgi:uncharacterized protein (DUF1697 family)